MSTMFPSDHIDGNVTYETAPPPKPGGKIALIAMIGGLIGAIACLLLAGGVWVGRSAANDKVDQVAASVTTVVEGGGTVVDTVTTKLDAVTASLDLISAQAAAVANTATPSDADEGTLRASLQNLGTRYDDIHASYEDLRVKIEGALDGLATVQKFFPSMETSVDTLNQVFTTVDQAVATLDANITDIRASIQNAQALPATAKSIVAGKLSTAVSTVSDAVGRLGGRIDNLKQDIRQIHDKAINYITYGAVGGTFVLIWVFLVNVGLFHYARRARRA